MEEVKLLMKSACDAIWINTYEEEACLNDIRELMSKNFRNMKLYVWSNTEGLKSIPLSRGEKADPPDKKMREVPALFDHIRNSIQEGNDPDNRSQTGALYVLRDLHNLMQDARTRRCIRDIREYRSARYFPIIVVAPSSEIHGEVSKLFRLVDYELPDRDLIIENIRMVNQRMEEAVAQGKTEYQPVPESEFDNIVKACLGLTINEVVSLFLRSMVKYKTLDLNFLMAAKIEAVKKSGLLQYIQPKISLADIGGHQILKRWFEETKTQFSEEARQFGLDAPKGCLMIGIQGTGKTMFAEAIAGSLGVPLLTFEMANVMNRMVGESENRVRACFDLVKSMGKSVLILDEIEKQVGGSCKWHSYNG